MMMKIKHFKVETNIEFQEKLIQPYFSTADTSIKRGCYFINSV